MMRSGYAPSNLMDDTMTVPSLSGCQADDRPSNLAPKLQRPHRRCRIRYPYREVYHF